MTAAWQTAKLGEVCNFINGLWKGERPPFVKAGVIRNANFLTDGTLDYSDVAHVDVEERKLEKRRLQYGDIILEKSGGGPNQPVGRVALFDRMDGVFSFSNFTSAVRVRDSTQLDFRFLHWFLHWIYISGKTAEIQSHSTGIRNLNGDAYKALEIAFPQLGEQRRIATSIDRAMGSIADTCRKSQAALGKIDQLFSQSLDQSFVTPKAGWNNSTIGAEFKFVDYRGKTPVKTKQGLRLITAKNVKMGFVQSEPLEYVDPRTYDAWMTRGIPNKGDVLFTTEAPLGNVAQLDTDEKVVFAQRIIILQPYRMDGECAKYLLMSPAVQKVIHAKGTGATVMGIKASLLKTVPVVFPAELSEQRSIAARLRRLQEATESFRDLRRRRLNHVKRLRKAMFASAFAGKL